MDLPVLLLGYCTAATVVLLFVLTALRGARRVDEQQDDDLIAALTRHGELLKRRSEPLPPMRTRETEEPLPRLAEDAPREPA